MEKLFFPMRLGTRLVVFISATMFLFSACKKSDRDLNPLLKHFQQVNLVDNNGEYHAKRTDPKLINAWGIAWNPTGVAWVNSQGGHFSAIWDAEGTQLRPPVVIPSPMDFANGNPTGIVFNANNEAFILAKGGAARFIFVGVDGILSAWNPAFGNTAGRVKINSATSAYTGLALAMVGSDPFLYAADFRANRIVVWNKNFAPVNWELRDWGVPREYAPYNIQELNGWLYVTYAKVGPTGRAMPGAGLGYVSVFKPTGEFVQRFASKGALNAPWGIAWAPASFFTDTEDEWDNTELAKGGIDLSSLNAILVGNFGDGRINVFTESGFYLGALKSKGKPIEIEGLWAISFPPATATTVDPNRLYFAAGPDEEVDGLFGYIIKK